MKTLFKTFFVIISVCMFQLSYGQLDVLPNGNVGVGNLNPQYKLDVNGSINFTDSLFVNGIPFSFDDGETYWVYDTSAQKIVSAHSIDVDGDVNFTGQLYQNGEPIKFDEEFWSFLQLYPQTISIGVPEPGPYKLDVGGDINFSGSLYQNGQPIYIGENALWSYGSSGVSSDNNVGIGVTAPNERLDVDGNINMTGVLMQNGVPVNVGGGESLWSGDSLSISYDGNVGIGTTEPKGILQLSQNGGNLTFQSATNNNTFFTDNGFWDGSNVKYIEDGFINTMQLYNGEMWFRSGHSGVSGENASLTTNMIIKNDGNVGIGTTSPSYKLDVSGDINFTGEILQNGQPLEMGGGQLWDPVAQNIALGDDTYSGTDKTHNIAIGRYALENNAQHYGIAIGYTALRNNTTGYLNTAIGFASMVNNTTGGSNTALGYNSLNKNETGSNNVAIGPSTLGSSTAGSNNIAIGNAALNQSLTAHHNTAVGGNAMQSLVTGNLNVAIGLQSMFQKTSGSGSIGIGYLSLRKANGNYNTGIGYNSLSKMTSGSYTVSVGMGSGADLTTGSTNIFIGRTSGKGITTGSNNVVIGGVTSLDAGMNSNIIIGTGNGVRRINVDNQGNVGLGVNDATHPLQMASGAHVTSGGVWTNASDISKKKNIKDLEYGLDELMQLKPKSYTYKSDNSESIGFIAQELEKIIPEVVSGVEGEKGVAYGLLTSLLVKVVQDQQGEIDELKATVAKLELAHSDKLTAKADD